MRALGSESLANSNTEPIWTRFLAQNQTLNPPNSEKTEPEPVWVRSTTSIRLWTFFQSPHQKNFRVLQRVLKHSTTLQDANWKNIYPCTIKKSIRVQCANWMNIFPCAITSIREQIANWKNIYPCTITILNIWYTYVQLLMSVDLSANDLGIVVGTHLI